jgi:hypothetical protein
VRATGIEREKTYVGPGDVLVVAGKELPAVLEAVRTIETIQLEPSGPDGPKLKVEFHALTARRGDDGCLRETYRCDVELTGSGISMDQ